MKIQIKKQAGNTIYTVEDEIQSIDDVKKISQAMEAVMATLTDGVPVVPPTVFSLTPPSNPQPLVVPGGTDTMSYKQLGFIEKLLKEKPMEVQAELSKLGVADYKVMTKKEASAILDALVGDRRGPKKPWQKKRY